MKLAIFACLLALALARPQSPGDARTIRFDNVNEGNGVFQYGFESDDGIIVDANGTPGVEGAVNIGGTFRFPLGNGQYLEVTYEADENGYRPSTRFVAQK